MAAITNGTPPAGQSAVGISGCGGVFERVLGKKDDVKN